MAQAVLECEDFKILEIFFFRSYCSRQEFVSFTVKYGDLAVLLNSREF